MTLFRNSINKNLPIYLTHLLIGEDQSFLGSIDFLSCQFVANCSFCNPKLSNLDKSIKSKINIITL